MKTRWLSERQIRWTEILSRYYFKLEFRLECLDSLPDALTRRSQNLSLNADDSRIIEWVMQLIPDGYLREPAENVANAASRTRVSPAIV